MVPETHLPSQYPSFLPHSPRDPLRRRGSNTPNSHESTQTQKCIRMVSDGMGPASLSLARTFMQYTQGVELNKQLPLDPYIVGTSRTRSHGPPF